MKKENKLVLSESDRAFIWQLMPTWICEVPPKGLDPTFYGTGSEKGDAQILKRVISILGENVEI